ncbi:MAG: AAA family ATPase [Streptosporangiaceae bacterium]|jgi:SpoVK/Ycf46/Vps4 family AAA+-type ATPase
MMLPNDRAKSAARGKPDWFASVASWAAGAPLWLKIVLVVPALLLSPVIAVIAVVTGNRSKLATAAVAVSWLYAFDLFSHVQWFSHPMWVPVLWLLPLAAALIAHAKPLARWFAPARTVGLALVWSAPLGIAALRVWPAHLVIGAVTSWLLAAAVLGWRAAKGLQDARMYAAPKGRPPAAGGSPGPGSVQGPNGSTMVPRGGVLVPRNGSGARQGQAAMARQGAANARAQAAAAAADAQAARPRPQITVEEAMAELDAMIGLQPVKEQVRSIAASVEAARRRAVAGVSTDKPMRHFVFLGPPGTGKTTVARVIAKIFYAFGLLDMPEVVEAQRSDLVGEYLGATAIKTNELIDSAIGGVLFIDEAYSLVNEGDGQSDRFGMEAVQTLLKRAEDNREDLIIILAGYEKQMESFLTTNPGLGSRFATRIKFPTYSPSELQALAGTQLDNRGESLSEQARPVLWTMLEEVGRRRITDELGNGRFVRSLLEKAGQARDVRVMSTGHDPSAAELITVEAADLEHAWNELTSRLRGYEETPTLEAAIAELDELVGLEPVKRQVHAIAAQLGVARLRDSHGLTSAPPSRHFVFTGPPGTGKTTVARIVGRIFAALGLLVRPEVIEAHRGDLVGEHLGSTAIKTNKLVDSAIGGVLFIDEAYSLHNQGYSGGDAYGSEAVQTLLKRAEDDRDRLVIVLAGYPSDMDRFLRSNPGLASRFSTRVAFPSYTPEDLAAIIRLLAEQAGDVFDVSAQAALAQVFESAAGRIDELGNGRFARSLFERSCASRDLRVVSLGESATAEDLTTITGDDVLSAYEDLIRR